MSAGHGSSAVRAGCVSGPGSSVVGVRCARGAGSSVLRAGCVSGARQLSDYSAFCQRGPVAQW